MRIRLEPEDDLLHAVEDARTSTRAGTTTSSTAATGLGGWVRMGNRPNEGYAEMTVCLYLPDGRVGFMFKRPPIDGHDAHDAGGLRFEVVAPYEEHRVTYDGKVCLLTEPTGDGRPEVGLRRQSARAVPDRPRARRGRRAVGRRTRVGRRRGAARPRSRAGCSPAATPSSTWPSRATSGSATSGSRSPTASGCVTTRGGRGCGRASGGTAGSP